MSELKMKAAKAALQYIEDDMIVGVGTGSTVNFLSKNWPQSSIELMHACQARKPQKLCYGKKEFPSLI